MKHPIPDAALELDIATLAMKGSGKTYANKGLVERLLQMGRRVVIMDPLNVWWGLKAKPDGSAGFPVTVVGGPNADIALDPTKGEALAAYVAKSHVQMVIDVSDLRSGELITFSIAFFGELYRVNREALWLILEEADVFAPQNPQERESFMLHEVDRLARRGRGRGFRLWTICQRPQELNKKVISQTSTLIMMRLMAPRDRAAAEDWMKSHLGMAEVKEISGRMASLPIGEGIILSPSLNLSTQARFPTILTLDTSKTPQAGDKPIERLELAKPDLTALEAIFRKSATTVADDPSKAAPAPSAQALEQALAEVQASARDKIEEGEKRLVEMSSIMNQALVKIGREAQSAIQAMAAFSTAAPKPAPPTEAPPSTPAPPTIEPSPSVPKSMSPAAKKIVAFYNDAWPRALDFDKAMDLAGIGKRSSQRHLYKPEVIANRVLEQLPDGRFRSKRTTPTGVDRLPMYRLNYSPSYQAILDVFGANRDGVVTKDQILAKTSISPTSSTTGAALSEFVSQGLIERAGDGWRMTEAFRTPG